MHPLPCRSKEKKKKLEEKQEQGGEGEKKKKKKRHACIHRVHFVYIFFFRHRPVILSPSFLEEREVRKFSPGRQAGMAWQALFFVFTMSAVGGRPL